MELDEYEYLERAVEFPAAKPSPPPAVKPSRRSEDPKASRRSEDPKASRRSEDPKASRRSEDPKPPRRSEDRHDDRDRDRDRRSRHRSRRDDERDRGRRSRSRSREREYDDRHRRHRDRRSREYEEDVERERERERRRRSISRHEREAEIERARSRERRARERESESMERRRFKEKKESELEADPERDQRTVFAYQMPLKATERDVYEFFSQAGKVRDVKLIMDRLSRRSKGVGYIEFYDAMSVPYAIALTNKLLLGQPVMVKASEAEKNLVQSTTTVASGAAGAGADRKIYVGNLHYNMTEVHLRQIFEAFGPLELVQLPLDPVTGHCKGYGFIQFQQLEHAKSARHLNGTLDIAGRIIKVSAVTDHVGGQNAATNVADFDDDDGSGLTLNARSRAILMQKLDRTGTATGIVESLGVPGLNGLAPNLPAAGLPINGVPLVPAIANAQHLPSLEPIGEPSECLLLKNMFDPSAETDPDFYSDIKEEVEEECSKFGPVRHIFVDRNSNGFVYLRFESVAPAAGCQRAMHNRYYAGRSISATFMRPQDYDARFTSDV